MSQNPFLSIVVFAFNEEDNVAPMLTELISWQKQSNVRTEIVFVDDGSSDRSLERAKQTFETAGLKSDQFALRKHNQNRGIGAALKTGVQAARGEWVTFLPADAQIPPSAIDTLVETQARDEADLVLSVYEDRDDGAFRKVLSQSVRALILAVHGVLLKSEGPYLFRKSTFLPEQLPSDTFFLNFEYPIRALAAGFKTSIATIHCRKRLSGSSKSTQLTRIAGVAKELVALRVRRFGMKA